MDGGFLPVIQLFLHEGWWVFSKDHAQLSWWGDNRQCPNAIQQTLLKLRMNQIYLDYTGCSSYHISIMCLYTYECMSSTSIYIKIIDMLIVFSLYLSIYLLNTMVFVRNLEQKSRKHVHLVSQTSVSLSLSCPIKPVPNICTKTQFGQGFAGGSSGMTYGMQFTSVLVRHHNNMNRS